jgi:hypothetical protein
MTRQSPDKDKGVFTAIFDKLSEERDVAIAERDAARIDRDAVIRDYQSRLAEAFTDTGAAVMERDAARGEAAEYRTLIDRCRERNKELGAQNEQMREDVTEFAYTMAALSPIWNAPMQQAWNKLFAVVDPSLVARCDSLSMD